MATMRGTAGRFEPGEAELRRAVVETAVEMSRCGLSPGRSGNVSARLGAGLLITPSAKAYATLSPADVVHVMADGSVAKGQGVPSSEWAMHLAVYRTRADAGAVVHAHSTHATALACAHKPIPAFHYMVLVAGGPDIPVAPYATPGSEELAQAVGKAFLDRRACLMANHGQIACGATLAAALELAQEVETLAEQYCKTLAVGGPTLLTAEHIPALVECFRTYGQRGKGQGQYQDQDS
jgi:L-fuculose-phosphate aldolase